MLKKLLSATFNIDGIKGPIPSQDDFGHGTKPEVFVNTINVIVYAGTVIAGIVLLAMLIMGGITYISSAGDEKMVTKAKKQITDALIGFVIVVMAWWVVAIVGVVFGIPLLKPKFIGI